MFIGKRGINMDIKKIKRRERRFYRKIVDGKIVYSDIPITKPKKETKDVIIEKKETKIKVTREIPEKTLKSIKDNKKLSATEKQQIIDKILIELKNAINPDIDEIAEMIYAQLSVRDVNVTQESVKHVVQNNAHHRSSRYKTKKNTSSQDTDKTKENYDFLNDRKELEKVLDDVVEENKKEDIRAKTRKDKLIQKVIQKAKDNQKAKDKKKKETIKKTEEVTIKKTEEISKEKPIKKKEPPKPKKEEFKLDFGDVEIDETDSDELGLKF